MSDAHDPPANEKRFAVDGRGGTNDPVEVTRRWVADFVVAHNLCPYAGAPLSAGQVEIVHSSARSEQALSEELAAQLIRMRGDNPRTVLLVHPTVLTNFDDYNQFLALGDDLVEALGLAGVIQIASFHPDYRFAGESASDIASATNRSPFPMLHLLREQDISQALGAHADPAQLARQITERNRVTLTSLGWNGWRALMRRVHDKEPDT